MTVRLPCESTLDFRKRREKSLFCAFSTLLFGPCPKNKKNRGRRRSSGLNKRCLFNFACKERERKASKKSCTYTGALNGGAGLVSLHHVMHLCNAPPRAHRRRFAAIIWPSNIALTVAILQMLQQSSILCKRKPRRNSFMAKVVLLLPFLSCCLNKVHI